VINVARLANGLDDLLQHLRHLLEGHGLGSDWPTRSRTNGARTRSRTNGARSRCGTTRRSGQRNRWRD